MPRALFQISYDLSIRKYRKSSIPICTLSPTCNSDIVTDFPFSRETLAVDGKQSTPPPPLEAVVVVVLGACVVLGIATPSQ